MINPIYSNDWFGRSNSDYVFNSSDMGRGIVKVINHKYSSFLYNEDRAERICSDESLLTYEIADMVKALGLGGIKINLSETNATACTNGKYIEIGIGDNYKNVSDCYEKLDRVIGMAIHESCHCIYTDFNYIKSILPKYPYYSDIIHQIHNVIEDEMIEQRLCVNFPGYENFLSKLKYNIFEKEANNTTINEDELNKIFELFFYIVRYPKFISKFSEDELNKYEKIFIKIKEIMNDYKCFDITNKECTRSSINAAIEIYELLRNYLIVNDKSEESESGEGNSENESGESKSGECNSKEESEESEESKSGECNSKEESEESEEGNSENESGESKSGEGNSENESEESEEGNSENESDESENEKPKISILNEEEQIKEIDEKINEAANDGILVIIKNTFNECSSISEISNAKEILVYHSNIEEKEKEGEFVFNKIENCGLTDDNINVWGVGDKNIYDMYAKLVSPYVKDAAKLIIPNRKKITFENTKFRRNGTLDPTRLVNAMCNEQTVYMQKTVKNLDKNPEYALVIMLDESGSMESDNKHVLATKLAIMLYEAMSQYPKIKLFVYGHGDTVYKYIDPFKNTSKYTLGNRRSQFGQDEITSYEKIINDVKSQTKLPIVCFNITDSCYLSNEREMAKIIYDYKMDKKQPTFINLICLSHNTYTDESTNNWNDIIYGKGNWVLYNELEITNKVYEMIKQMSTIIKKTVHIK